MTVTICSYTPLTPHERPPHEALHPLNREVKEHEPEGGGKFRRGRDVGRRGDEEQAEFSMNRHTLAAKNNFGGSPVI